MHARARAYALILFKLPYLPLDVSTNIEITRRCVELVYSLAEAEPIRERLVTDKLLRKIIVILAEKAYRRGFQHGVEYASEHPNDIERCKKEASTFRYVADFTPGSREQSPMNGVDWHWRRAREAWTVAERHLEMEHPRGLSNDEQTKWLQFCRPKSAEEA